MFPDTVQYWLIMSVHIACVAVAMYYSIWAAAAVIIGIVAEAFYWAWKATPEKTQ